MDESNPYDPATAVGAEPTHADPGSLSRTIIAGTLWSLVSAFPITALMALFFRFPVPFAGIDGGVSHVIPSMFALLFYGVAMGGFVVVAICGAIAGAVAWAIVPTAQEQRRLQRCLSVGITFFLLFVLATLDWYIGPW